MNKSKIIIITNTCKYFDADVEGHCIRTSIYNAPFCFCPVTIKFNEDTNENNVPCDMAGYEPKEDSSL